MFTKKYSIIPKQQQNSINTIIFDLKDVLFKTPRTQEAMIILAAALKNPSLLHLLFTKNIPCELDTILQQVPAQTNSQTEPMYHANKQLPQILVDWLIGRTSHDVLQETLAWLAKNSHYPHSKKTLCTSVVKWLFNPEKYIESMSPIKHMRKLAYTFKAQGYKVYILSNWDTESFPLLTKKFQHFFDIFDGVMISGTEGTGKPDPEFYQRLLQKYNINPTQSIFIDDEPHNVTAANNLGIHGVVYDSFKSACNQLKKIGVMK